MEFGNKFFDIQPFKMKPQLFRVHALNYLVTLRHRTFSDLNDPTTINIVVDLSSMSSRDYYHPFSYQLYAFFVEYVFFATAIYCIFTAIGDFIFEKSIFGSIKKIEIQNWITKYITDFRWRWQWCWWLDVGDPISLLVTNIPNLSATHLFTNVRHQHRCNLCWLVHTSLFKALFIQLFISYAAYNMVHVTWSIQYGPYDMELSCTHLGIHEFTHVAKNSLPAYWLISNFFILYIYLATIIKINFLKNPNLGYSQILNL